MVQVLLIILQNTGESGKASHFFITKLMALPTANKNEGKTRSVGVKPFHCACNNGENVVAPFPGVFTMIIRHIVIPLNTSNAVNRFCKVVMMKYLTQKVRKIMENRFCLFSLT